VSTKEQLVLPFPGGPLPGGAFPPVEDGETDVCGDDHASVSAGRDEGGAANAANAAGRGGDVRAAAKARPIPQNRRELALAIFAQCDPVALGVEIVENNDDRNPTTLLRALETFAEWAYGKEDAEPEPAPTRVIWDLPRQGERRDGASGAGSEPAGGGER
jgi:hypothetical protein